MQSIRRQCQLNKATFFDESLPSDFLLGTGIRCDSQSWLLNYSETSVMVRHLRHALRELCEGRRLSSGSSDAYLGNSNFCSEVATFLAHLLLSFGANSLTYLAEDDKCQ